MTIHYDVDQGSLLTACSIAHTVLPSVVKGLEFWLFLVLHLVLWCSFRNGALDHLWVHENTEWGMNWEYVKVVTSMTTFFEVFYSNQCYARYTGLYKSTRMMLGDTYNYAHLVRMFMKDQAPNHARASVRCVLATVLLHFYDLKDKDSEFEMDELRRLGILRRWEIPALLQHPKKHRPCVMLGWATMFATEGLSEAKVNIAREMCFQLMKIRDSQQDVVDTLALQVPFQYYHLLSIMVMMNLSMWAYAMALTDSWFAPLVFICCSLIFIGMMTLAGELSDPFGNDAVDFNIDQWVALCIEVVAEITEDEYPGGDEGMQATIFNAPPCPTAKREVLLLR